MKNSIRGRLTIAFISLAIGPLLLVGVVLAWQSFTTQQQQALTLQQEVARRVVTQVTAFFEELENQLHIVSHVQGLQELNRDQQQDILSELLAYQNVFEELVLLDSQGQEQVHLARLEIINDLGERTQADEFVIPYQSGEVYYSPIRVEEATGEPLMTIAVPLFDVRTGLVDGVLVSEVRIKRIWNLILDTRVSPGQSVYIVDAQDTVVAHRNLSVVLRGTLFDVPEQDGLQPGLTGSNTVLAVETVGLGQQEFNIVVEQEWSEALALFINSMEVIGVVIMIALVASGLLGLLIVRQIVRPIQAMATTAQAISAGDLSQQVKFTGQDELGVLARAFNSMTTQLGELIASLEQRVLARTQRLELAATLGERMSAILHVDQLLADVVNQIKDNFGYYHAHIYLLDDKREKLVVAEGAGPAGAEMKARGHNILLNAPTSLVAGAARTGQIIRVDNVREAADWLPNSLLPDTYSEMAVPIILEGEVVGVLDVQSNKISGLDEGDANLLRSLANQVAVAIRNARQFGRVEMALAEVRAAQERYLEQTWGQAKTTQQQAAYQYQRPGALPLDSEIQNPNVLAVPIQLQNQTIGVIQLHETEQPHPWNERELALVRAVAEQVAQTAESLRLFEETRERAGRERAIREITDKLRAAPNLDRLLETAARELGQRLGVRHTMLELGIEAETPAKSNGAADQNGKQSTD